MLLVQFSKICILLVSISKLKVFRSSAAFIDNLSESQRAGEDHRLKISLTSDLLGERFLRCDGA